MACALPPPGGGGKRGRDTKVSLPLLTPQPFLRTRLPSVARLNARGPQGCLVLQEYTLDRSGAFRSAKQAPGTVWPRTMRGQLRKKQIQGSSASHISRPIYGTEPHVTLVSLHISDVSAQRRVWETRKQGEPYGALAPLPRRRAAVCRFTQAETVVFIQNKIDFLPLLWYTILK